MINKYPPRYFRCDCNLPGHFLFVDYETMSFEAPPEVWLAVGIEPQGWRDRLKGAWKVLWGGEHIFGEVYIHRDEFTELVDYLASALHNPNTK